MNFLKVFIALIIAATIAVVLTKPDMHKPFRTESADFKLSVITENPPAPVQNTLKQQAETVKKYAQNTETVIAPQKQKPKIITETRFIVQKQPETKVPQSQKTSSTPKQQESKEIKQQEPVIKQKVQTQQPQKVKKLTPEEEEIIAWNEWRSNLQNQVMRDVVLAAPVGTRFEFSFTVDKFGRISNLKVWSKNPQYTDMAVRKIKPVLLSYQGQSILKFPEKSKRVITNVNGGFTIAWTSRYSTPSDYSDYERIK